MVVNMTFQSNGSFASQYTTIRMIFLKVVFLLVAPLMLSQNFIKLPRLRLGLNLVIRSILEVLGKMK